LQEQRAKSEQEQKSQEREPFARLALGLPGQPALGQYEYRRNYSDFGPDGMTSLNRWSSAFVFDAANAGRPFHMIQTLYTANQRLGLRQGSAPLEVKQVIWRTKRRTVNDPGQYGSLPLTVKQEKCSDSNRGFRKSRGAGDGAGLFYAWHHIAIRSHWLTAYTSSHMLEPQQRTNRQGGGMSFRMGKKFEDELGINLKKMISLDLHVVADTEHSENISEMFDRYVKTPEDRELVLQGARDCMASIALIEGVAITWRN
jgi:hypothetical protein